LTGYKAIRLRDEEGNRELGNGKKNERELEGLHVLCTDGRRGRSERFESGEMTVREFEASFFVEKGYEENEKV